MTSRGEEIQEVPGEVALTAAGGPAYKGTHPVWEEPVVICLGFNDGREVDNVAVHVLLLGAECRG